MHLQHKPQVKRRCGPACAPPSTWLPSIRFFPFPSACLPHSTQLPLSSTIPLIVHHSSPLSSHPTSLLQSPTVPAPGLLPLPQGHGPHFCLPSVMHVEYVIYGCSTVIPSCCPPGGTVFLIVVRCSWFLALLWFLSSQVVVTVQGHGWFSACCGCPRLSLLLGCHWASLIVIGHPPELMGMPCVRLAVLWVLLLFWVPGPRWHHQVSWLLSLLSGL